MSTHSNLLSADSEARILWHIRVKQLWTQLTLVLRENRLRTLIAVSLCLFFWGGLFALFYEGFSFITNQIGKAGGVSHAGIIRSVFSLFFLSLNLMLVFSTAIILYGGLYRTDEARMLLSMPVREERVFLHKFQEAIFYSSWGFFLLASPMMVAYGLVVAAPWHYYALLLPFILSFVYIPSGLGAFFCLLATNWIPRISRNSVMILAAVVLLFTSHSIWLTVQGTESQLFGQAWLQETQERFQFAQNQLLPSTWISNGLLEAARHSQVSIKFAGTVDNPILNSFQFLAVLVSNSLMGHLILLWFAKRWLRSSYSTLQTDGPAKYKTQQKPSFFDRFLDYCLHPFPDQVRLLLVKDWKIFRRDPMQWSQFLIFVGMLFFYFMFVDRFQQTTENAPFMLWVHVVSFINLSVVGLILSAFSTRFIFPMISLEGNRFWILGLLPVHRDTIVWSKFFFATFGAWAPCGLLVLCSDLMLEMPKEIIFTHQINIFQICAGIASLSVGLGAILPNMKESSPSKIAAGFGGTLSLVISAFYILSVLALSTLPAHLYQIQGGSQNISTLNFEQILTWKNNGMIASFAVTLLTVAWPLRVGLRNFRKLEF